MVFLITIFQGLSLVKICEVISMECGRF
jgi:hypothetical protein